MHFPINIFNFEKRNANKKSANNPRGADAQNCLTCRAVCSVILGISAKAFILPKLHKQNFRGRKGIWEWMCDVDEKEGVEEEEEE